MPRTSTLTGEKMRTFLTAQAQKQQNLISKAEELMAEAGQIEQEVFLPLNLDPATLVNGHAPKSRKSASTGNRAKKGEQEAAIQKLLQVHRGKITTQDAIAAFETVGFRTAANAVLMRMKKAGTVANPERGVWTAPTAKAKATKATK